MALEIEKMIVDTRINSCACTLNYKVCCLQLNLGRGLGWVSHDSSLSECGLLKNVSLVETERTGMIWYFLHMTTLSLGKEYSAQKKRNVPP